MAQPYMLAYYIHIFLAGQCGFQLDIPYESYEVCSINAEAQMRVYHKVGHTGGYAYCMPGLLKPGIPQPQK